MVSVVFKTVYLFLALLALPQVLAAPGATVVDLHSRATQDEILKLHNDLRAASNVPPLTWSRSLQAFAASRVNTCRRDDNANPPVLVAGSGSFAEAFQDWAGRPEGFTQITSNAARVVGCAVTTNDCNGNPLIVCAYNSR